MGHSARWGTDSSVSSPKLSTICPNVSKQPATGWGSRATPGTIGGAAARGVTCVTTDFTTLLVSSPTTFLGSPWLELWALWPVLESVAEERLCLELEVELELELCSWRWLLVAERWLLLGSV